MLTGFTAPSVEVITAVRDDSLGASLMTYRLRRNHNLTSRERELARLIATGCSNQDIAKYCGISERTVKNHIVSIYRKLRIRNRVELTLWCLKRLHEIKRHPSPRTKHRESRNSVSSQRRAS